MAGAISIQIKGLDGFAKRLARRPEVMEDTFGKAMFSSTEKIKQDAKREAPRGVSSPGIKNALASRVKKWNLGVVGILQGKADHAIYVEKGTRPHFPPYQEGTPLHKWARIKLGNAAAAFPIAQKIAAAGTEAQPFLEPAFKNNARFIQTQFSKALNQLMSMK